jgi:DNA polymerase-3 subunit delta'
MWNNVIGQERVKKILQQSLASEKIPNAYLFMGSEGIGKDAMAIELAKALNCLTPSMNGTEACDQCANCKSIASLGSPLLHFVFALAKDSGKSEDSDDEDEDGVAKVNIVREQIEAKARDSYHNIEIPKALTINVKQIRDLRLHLSRSMAGGRKRVVIISEADTMRKEAQNAFLKTLEEPHKNTLIILTSSNPSHLYATILSRCQDLRFDLLAPKEIAEALNERDGLEKDQAEFLSRLAGGSYSVARGLISEDVTALRTQVVQLLRAGLDKASPRTKTTEEMNIFIPRGGTFLEKRQTIEQLLHLLTLWLRDALALSSGSDQYLFNSDQLTELNSFVSKFGTPPKIIGAMRAIEIAQRNVRLQLQLRPVILQMMMDIEGALNEI